MWWTLLFYLSFICLGSLKTFAENRDIIGQPKPNLVCRTGAMIRKRVNLTFNTSDRFGATTMEQPQTERQAAAQVFKESLAQLEQTFEPIEPKPANSMEELPLQTSLAMPDASEPYTQEITQFSLSSFEDAIADLEQFLQNNQSSKIPSQSD